MPVAPHPPVMTISLDTVKCLPKLPPTPSPPTLRTNALKQKGMVWRHMTRTTPEQEGTSKRDVLTKALFQTLARHLSWDKGQEKNQRIGSDRFSEL